MSVLLSILAVSIAAGAIAFAATYRRENRPDRVLALLYHRLVTDDEYARCPPTEKIFSIPERRFRDHLGHLKAEGYHAVSLDAVVDFVRSGAPLPPKPVLVTFDDGSVSVHEKALPILREMEMPATLFVTTDPDSWVFKLGTNPQRRLTAFEIRELSSGGVTIGSHAVTHEPLEAMTEEEIRRELGESKLVLEEILGAPVRYFGVPLNWYGPKVRRAAQAVGYAAVCTSDNGTIHRDSDLFHLKRFIIEGSFDAAEFARNLGAGAIVQRRVVNAVKRFPARLLGPRLWLPLRRRLFESFLGRFFTLRRFKAVLATGVVLLIAASLLLVWWVTGSR